MKNTFISNKKKRYVTLAIDLIALAIISIFLTGFSNDNNQLHVSVDLQKKHQTIHSFGASDAWRCQYVGKNWPKEKKEKIARWLFSKEFDAEGNPQGIGLSMWRFYIGSGSMEQGNSSGITHTWRRAECFQNGDGTYNWDKQLGQQWFLQKSKQYGVEYALAFTISPPVHQTLNAKAFASKGRKQLNIKPGMLDDYAKFLVDVCQHFESVGMGFDYLSPFNEPQWDWNGPSQEGTPATNDELFLLTKYLDKEIVERDIPLKLAFGEAADIRFLTKEKSGYEGFSNQVNVFLDTDSPLYIGEMKSVAPVLSGHSYFTTWPADTLIHTRKELKEKMVRINPGFSYWQSEYCILEKNDETVGGNKRDLGMATALFVARAIHHDIVTANASSWQWWTALSQCDYKDGLIYLDNRNSGVRSQDHPDNEALKYNGEFRSSKLLWVLGNFSRFVRPGMQRVEVCVPEMPNDKSMNDDLLISGYLNHETNELVLVVINRSDNLQEISLPEELFSERVLATYTTTENMDLKYRKMEHDLKIEKKAVMTIVGNIK